MHCLRVAIALMLGVAPVLAQSPSRDWRPADRTVIGDFTRVTSVAAAIDRVFVTSLDAVLIWHPQPQQWDGPYSPPAPSLLADVFTALIDPLDNSLWLGRTDGWVHYQPDLQTWDSGVVPDGVVAIAFDANDPISGLYLRTRRGWSMVPRGGFIASPARPPARPLAPTSVQQALRSAPTLEANSAQILVDPRLRTVRYTAAARSVDNLGWYLGTSGVGLLYLADGSAIPERLAFGIPSQVVGALFGVPGGVWAATNRTRQTDAALTFVDRELRDFRSLRGPAATGVPFGQVRELTGAGTSLWAATDYGLARIDTREGRIELVDAGRGLPDSRVYAAVSRQGRITAGTEHGVVRVNDSLRVERVAPIFTEAAYAVFPVGDTICVGTSRGLLVALPRGQDLVRPSTLASAAFRAPVIALSALGDTLVALTRDQMLWRNPRSGAWTLGPTLSALLGGLRGFIPDGAGFWIAGDRGVAFARLDTPPMRPLRMGDLPGPANDIAVEGEYLWVGTDAGLVRFRLDAVRP